ncbi:MAG: hypothetical protein A2W93_08065 [Bacteroidetes bacterium GWF2_43_63]|nr:MAG: hypothetical protein A2W94_04720 [Bacteroidetes bacterium GWE2_42_42]OFY55569.1 MAG: hypothetical protein A2W93_08065 [Bacteroidetes bacterium GWF2_43_63]HBG71581.1 hypothetical protein [Bacteroidales bacterium]HCB62114.1 hypothetical protein [Bacteroidales bacterium]HCY22342.1 hypothetical protein [Bacteroidales bacterium]
MSDMYTADSIQQMLDSIYDGIMVLDINSGKYVYANQCACELYGCPKDMVKDLDPADLSVLKAPYDEAAINAYSETARKEGKCVFEWLAKKLDGSHFWAEVALTYAEIDGKFNYIAVVRDTSAKKAIETEKNKTNAQLRAILDSSPDALAIINSDGVFLDGNKSFLERWDKQPDEIIGHSAIEILPKDIFDSRLKKIRQVIKTKIPVSFVDTFNGKWFEIFISPVLENDGSSTSIAMTSRNITDAKTANDTLKAEHDHLVDVLESMSDAFVSIDTDWFYTYVNQKAGEIFGKDPQWLTGKHIWTVFPEGVGQPFQKNYEKVMKQRVPVSMEEYYPPLDKWFENRIYPTENGISIFFHDITDIKSTELQIKESELRYKAIFENTGTAAVIIEEDTIISLANSKFEELSGFTRKEIENIKSWKEFVAWDDLVKMEEQHMLRRLKNEAALKSYEFRFVDRNGVEKYILLTVDIIPGSKRSVASLLDISEIKNNEITLRESEAKYRLLFEHNPLPMLIYERGTLKMISVNESFLKLYGYTAEQISQMHLTDLYPEKDKKPITELAHRIQGHEYAGEWRHLKSDGTLIDILATSHDIRYNNRSARIAVINDITERKKIEQEILRSEKQLKEAQHVAKLGNWEHVPATNEIIWSDEMYSIFEIDPSASVSLFDSFIERMHPDDKEKVEHEYFKTLKKIKESHFEHRLLMPDGRVKYVFVNCFCDPDRPVTSAHIIGTMQDITERKKIELELQRSRMLLRSMIDALPMWLAAIDLDGKYFIANKFYSQTFKLPLDQIENHNYSEFFPPDLYQRHKLLVDQCIESKKAVEVTDLLELEKGIATHIYGAYTPLFDENGNIFGLSAAVMDISKQKAIEEEIIRLNQTLEEKVAQRTTELARKNEELVVEISERVKAEELIKHQLQEKEVLLQEIHHRVKNNMQVIVSILNLQLSSVRDEHTRRILRDSQTRIKTMALVHEKLYETTDFSNIDLIDYIKNLFEFLTSIYKSPNENIQCKITGKSFKVDIDTIIAIGLITNEIVTNSFKYAFDPGTMGLIEIKLTKKDEKNLVYSIKDNGKGLPEGFDIRNTKSLGLQLVSILTEQINGTIEVKRSAKGTEFIIVFPPAG